MYMKNRPLVSICIPTYNRSIYLRQSLERYIVEKEFIDGKVEIVISDNASTDDTKMVVEEYIKKYKNIRYYRNTENIRDKNFPLALSRGSGILHRLCNDTLQISRGHLEDLCHTVCKYEKDKPFLFWQNEGIKKSEVMCDNLDSYIRKLSYFVTWIGGFSLWHDECKGIELDTKDCELSLWQVRKSCEIATNKRSIIVKKLFCTVPVISNKDVSYGIFRVFHGNMFEILNRYAGEKGISNQTLEYVEKDLLYGYFTDFLVLAECKKDNNLIYSDEEDLKNAVVECYKNKTYYNDYLKFYQKAIIKARIISFIKPLIRWEKYKNSRVYQLLKEIAKQIGK